MNKTFRLFISSTFNDFRKERELLQTKIFPIIKEYALSQDYTFQPIDLRWGVNDEAQLDQKTLDLCLNEVRACKTTLHPNFLVMLGDRYGWIPLPYAIEESELTSLLTLMDKKEKEDIQEWYYLDQNQIPASYILRERTDVYKEYNRWVQVENNLRTILQKTVNNSSISSQQKEKYFQSATEAEVEEGILQFKSVTKFQKDVLNEENDTEHIFGFFRDIDKSTREENQFIEDDYERAQTLKKEVKKELHAGNILTTQTSQIDKATLNETYLIEFEKRIVQFLKSQIDIQKERELQDNFSPLTMEIQAQRHFAMTKRKNFLSQEKSRKLIADYICSDKREALVVYGKSGSGKSALISKVIQEQEETLESKVIYRFVGATPHSSTSKEILTSIFNQLGIDLSSSNKEETFEEFSYSVSDAFSSITNPTTIFIDAIDQLQNDDDFLWIPNTLPTHIKLIISALNDENYHNDSKYFNTLQNKSIQTYMIPQFDAPMELLEKILEQANRKIDDFQKEYFLNLYNNINSPLYVIIAAQEMKNWKSGDITQKLVSSKKEVIGEFISNLTELYHHDREFVQKVLGFLYASRDGLSESELLILLTQDKKFIERMGNDWHNNINKELPLIHWSRLHTQLKPFLSYKTQDNTELMYFFHREFEDTIKNMSTQNLQHHHFIIMNQILIFKNQYQDFHKNRWGKIYLKSIVNYEISYGQTLKNECNTFISSITDTKWKQDLVSLAMDTIELYTHNNQFITAQIYAENTFKINDTLQAKEAHLWSESYLISASQLISSYNKNNSSLVLAFIDANFSRLEAIFLENQDSLTQTFSAVLKTIAASYFAQNNYEQAHYYMQESYNLYLETSYTEKEIIPFLHDMGVYSFKTKQFDAAKFYFDAALETLEELGYQSDHYLKYTRISIISSLMSYYLYEGLTQENLLLIESAANELERNYQTTPKQWLMLYVVYMNQLSDVYRNLSKKEEELAILTQLESILSQHYKEEPFAWGLDYFSILFNFGGLYIQAQLWDHALDYLLNAYNIATKGYIEDPQVWAKEYMRVLTDLAGTYNAMGNIFKSIQVKERKVEVCKELYLQDNNIWYEEYSDILQGIATSYENIGNNSKRIDVYKALYVVIINKFGIHSQEANALEHFIDRL